MRPLPLVIMQIAQRRCNVCGGSGLVQRGEYYFRCGGCGKYPFPLCVLSRTLLPWWQEQPPGIVKFQVLVLVKLCIISGACSDHQVATSGSLEPKRYLPQEYMHCSISGTCLQVSLRDICFIIEPDQELFSFVDQQHMMAIHTPEILLKIVHFLRVMLLWFPVSGGFLPWQSWRRLFSGRWPHCTPNNFGCYLVWVLVS